MLKKTLLSTAFVASNFVMASIAVNFDVAMQTNNDVVHVASTVITENNRLASFENDDFIVDILPNVEEDEALIQANIYQKIEAEVQLIAQPVLKTILNEDGGIALSNDEGNTLTFVVNVSQAEQVDLDQVE
jgi:hypothetical protein